MKRAAIYARYSSAGQRDQSIADQIKACEEYAERNDYEIVAIYADHAVSGRTDKRADFQRMLADSDSKAFEAVLVWQLDRFGRNREEMAINRRRLRQNGVKIVSAIENIPEGPDGILIESIKEGLAEYYSKNLSINVKRGMRSNAEKAEYNGGAIPLGYDIVDRHYSINETEAEVVRKIFSLAYEGYGYVEIARMMTDEGYKTKNGKNFNGAGIKFILCNRRYMGEYVFGDIVHENAIPPIINKEEFEEVQEIIKKHGKVKKRARVYPLSGKIFCAHCGKPYIADGGINRLGNYYRYYSCSGRKIDKECKNDNYNASVLEDAIIKTSLFQVLTDKNIKKLSKKILKLLEKNREESPIQYWNEQLKQVNSKIRNLLSAIESGVSIDSAIERLQELDSEKAQLEAKIKIEKNKKPLPTLQAVEWFLNTLKTYDFSNNLAREKLINTIIKSVYIDNDIVTIFYNLVGIDNIDIDECSIIQKMADHSFRNLNTIEVYESGIVSYSFRIAA